VAGDLLTFPAEISGQDGQLPKAVFSSDTCSSEPRSGLSRDDDSNMVCEPYCADALVKHNARDFAIIVCKAQMGE